MICLLKSLSEVDANTTVDSVIFNYIMFNLTSYFNFNIVFTNNKVRREIRTFFIQGVLSVLFNSFTKEVSSN